MHIYTNIVSHLSSVRLSHSSTKSWRWLVRECLYSRWTSCWHLDTCTFPNKLQLKTFQIYILSNIFLIRLQQLNISINIHSKCARVSSEQGTTEYFGSTFSIRVSFLTSYSWPTFIVNTLEFLELSGIMWDIQPQGWTKDFQKTWSTTTTGSSSCIDLIIMQCQQAPETIVQVFYPETPSLELDLLRKLNTWTSGGQLTCTLFWLAFLMVHWSLTIATLIEKRNKINHTIEHQGNNYCFFVDKLGDDLSFIYMLKNNNNNNYYYHYYYYYYYHYHYYYYYYYCYYYWVVPYSTTNIKVIV